MKLYVGVLLLLFACGQKQAEIAKVMTMEAPVMEADYEVAENAPPSEEYSGDLILRSAHFKFQVENVEKSTENIAKLVVSRQGLISNQDLSNATNEIANKILIRVPSTSFEALLGDLGKEAVFINYKRVSSQNVTEEYQDIQTRLKTKREVRDRYTDILKTRAKTVEDILKAEEHIRILQEEIEAKEGRLRFLQTRVAMSEIDLEIYQKVIYKEAPLLVEKAYATQVTEALASGWSLIRTGVLFLVSGWPVLILVFAIFWRWRFLRSRQGQEPSI